MPRSYYGIGRGGPQRYRQGGFLVCLRERTKRSRSDSDLRCFTASGSNRRRGSGLRYPPVHSPGPSRSRRSWAGPCALAWRPRPWPSATAAWTVPGESGALGVVMGTGLVPIDLPEMAPMLSESCDETGRLRADRLGQKGNGASVSAVVARVPAEHDATHISLIHRPRGPTARSPRPAPPVPRPWARPSDSSTRDAASCWPGSRQPMDPLLFLAYYALGALSPGRIGHPSRFHGPSRGTPTALSWARAEAW